MLCVSAGRPSWNGRPGPTHTTTPPSPISQVTDSGVATAVALTVPADAVTESWCQIPASIHSQVGRFTTDEPDGLKKSDGTGRSSERSAWSATSWGSTAGAVAAAWSGIHSVRVVAAPVTSSMQVTEYHPPGVGPPGAKPPSSLRTSEVSMQTHGLPPLAPPPLPPPGAPAPPPGPPGDETPSEAPTVTVPPGPSDPAAPAKAGLACITETAAATAATAAHRAALQDVPFLMSHRMRPPPRSGSPASSHCWSAP